MGKFLDWMKLGVRLYLSMHRASFRPADNVLLMWWRQMDILNGYKPNFFKQVPPMALPVSNYEVMIALIVATRMDIYKVTAGNPWPLLEYLDFRWNKGIFLAIMMFTVVYFPSIHPSPGLLVLIIIVFLAIDILFFTRYYWRLRVNDIALPLRWPLELLLTIGYIILWLQEDFLISLTRIPSQPFYSTILPLSLVVIAGEVLILLFVLNSFDSLIGDKRCSA